MRVRVRVRVSVSARVRVRARLWGRGRAMLRGRARAGFRARLRVRNLLVGRLDVLSKRLQGERPAGRPPTSQCCRTGLLGLHRL